MAAIAWDLGPAETRAPRSRLRVVDQAGVRTTLPCVPAAVYRRRRIVAAAVVVLAALAIAMAMAPALSAPAAQAPPSARAGEPVTIVVGPGDTVWQLAAPHAPAGTDPMAYVVEVAAFNDVDPRAVRPGTVLRLPAAAE